MKDLPEVFNGILAETIKRFARECGINEQTDDCELRPDGLQDHVNMLLRRELVKAADEGNKELLNELSEYLSRPKEFVLYSGLISDIKLEAELMSKNHNPLVSIIPMPVNKKAWRYLKMKFNQNQVNSIN